MSSSTLSAGAKADKAPAAAKKTPAKTPAGAKPVPPSSSKLASSGPLAGKATSKPATPAPGKPSSAQLQKGGALPISAASKKVGTPPVHAPSPLSQPPVTASKAPKPSPTTAPPKPAHGYKPNSTYEAPNGFQFTPVYHDKVKSEAGLSPFDARHLADDDGNPLKELWLIKVPPGVSAEDLKDLKFDPLLKDGTLGKGKVNGTKHELVVLPPADRGEMSELEPLVPSFDAGEDDGGGMVFGERFHHHAEVCPIADNV